MRTNSKLNESVSNSDPVTIADPQVKASRQYNPRRAFTNGYKLRILAAYEACETASARGELLRREGLYQSRISVWKREKAIGKLDGAQNQKGAKNTARVDHLARENEQLKKKLLQAEAIIDLQKKVSELFGNHILPLTNSEWK
jgi:hypothetical protein